MNPIQSACAPQGAANQSVYTPQSLMDLINEIWPEGLECDAFPGLGAPVSAMARTCLVDGFGKDPWPARTYANPPFNRLKLAMAKARECSQCLLLGPAQTHRAWFWEHGGDLKAWLRPVAFHGYTSAFPRPLVLHYYSEGNTVLDMFVRDAMLHSKHVIRVDP